MNRNKLRNAFRTLHLWMGLGSGLILFVVCLSGTIYTFRAEIERWLEPEKYYAANAKGVNLFSADSLIHIAEKRHEGKLTSVLIPADKSKNWLLTIKKNNGEGKPKIYFINPYTGETAGEQGGSTNEFFATVLKMHRWLLMGESTGRIIVGTATIIMFFMVLTGLILWFPAQVRYWRQGLKIKTSANWKRINHDLHSVLGFYAFSILLVVTLTGLCWSFEWYRDGLSSVLGSKVFKGKGEKPALSDEKAASRGFIGADYILSETARMYPYEGNTRLSLSEDSMGTISVFKNATGFFAVAGVDKIQFDRFTGDPVKIENFSDKDLNAQIADSIKLLHTGEMFGTSSKIIYFLACLIATSLPVTGTIIWLNKTKKKKKPAKMITQKEKEFA